MALLHRVSVRKPPLFPMVSFDFDGDWHTDCGEGVYAPHGDGGFGDLGVSVAGSQVGSDDGLVACHRGFGEGSSVVAGLDLPRLGPDLGDAAAVDRLVEGCDGIVHLGGISREDSFSRIMQANILGLYNLYEAARAHGMPRIIFASSNHTVGFYPQDAYLGPDCTFRPDGLYGVSKVYGEALARMYF